MLRSLQRWFGNAADPLAYRVPLDWFEQQVAQDLLSTGLHWMWESSRGFKAVQASLPDQRSRTVLTPDLAAVFGAEIGEYYLEDHREMTVFATETSFAGDLRLAGRQFAETGAGPLVAILYQPPHGAAEVFLPRSPMPVLSKLLNTWAERLGKRIEGGDGGPTLRRMFAQLK